MRGDYQEIQFYIDWITVPQGTGIIVEGARKAPDHINERGQ